MRRVPKLRVVGAGLASVLLLLAPAVSVKAANAAYGSCRHVSLPVALSALGDKNQTVSGTLCTPNSWASGPHEIDVTTAGATYNSAYWDWPQNPSLYSYVDKTLQAGRATFNYDRVGTGASSHPLSTLLTVPAESYVLHQVVGYVRSQGFSQVNTIGHSYGSIISIEETGSYHDVNRLVVTGLLHLPNVSTAFPQILVSLLHPAPTDPQFAGKGYDAGYLTTIPGTRQSLFYGSTADPAVIAYDEAHKDLFPSGALATLAATWFAPVGLNASNRINIPVLTIIGQQDGFFCKLPALVSCTSNASVRTFEAPYYSSATSLTAETVPNTAHDLTLHPSANQSFQTINQWVKTH